MLQRLDLVEALRLVASELSPLDLEALQELQLEVSEPSRQALVSGKQARRQVAVLDNVLPALVLVQLANNPSSKLVELQLVDSAQSPQALALVKARRRREALETLRSVKLKASTATVLPALVEALALLALALALVKRLRPVVLAKEPRLADLVKAPLLVASVALDLAMAFKYVYLFHLPTALSI